MTPPLPRLPIDEFFDAMHAAGYEVAGPLVWFDDPDNPGREMAAVGVALSEVKGQDNMNLINDPIPQPPASARDRAVRWAQGVLQREFVVLDVETTGLDGDAQALTIGVVSKSGEVLLDARARPTVTITQEAAAVNGITPDEAATFPPFAECYGRLVELLYGQTVVSYCVGGFDWRILNQTCWANDLPVIEFGLFLELLEPFGAIYGEPGRYSGYRWQKLTTAAAFFGIDTDGAHGAVADAVMALRVLEAMAALGDERAGDEESE